jgi:hypothetical protein
VTLLAAHASFAASRANGDDSVASSGHSKHIAENIHMESAGKGVPDERGPPLSVKQEP